MRMPLLDRAFYLLDSARSPQDFTLILHLNDAPEVDRLYAGAKSAMNRFPTSACCVDGQAWVWRENKYFKLEMSASELERFIDEPFDLRREPPVKQILILDGEARLATRFHHSAADGLSAALWLGHQLNVAYGLEAAQSDRSEFNDLALRRLPVSVRRSQFAFESASDSLWTRNSKRSGTRRWLTIDFPAAKLQKLCRRAGGFTYNDLLATCTLEVLRCWNSTLGRPQSAAPTSDFRNIKITGCGCRGGPPWPPVVSQSKIGLWMPMNIRRKAGEGFGNGTSRIRVYATYDADAKLIQKCREVRRQVAWTTEHGEWVVPEIPWFTRLPRPIAGPFLRAYLSRSAVDMATAVFSHAGSGMANACEAFKHVEKIESIGLLHPRQNLAINAATHHGHTWLTLTYDPALLSTEDANELSRLYEEQIGLAYESLY